MYKRQQLARLRGGAEVFYTLQGEGPSTGRPSVFVRASLCNLHCVWCDTDYTWNWRGTPFPHARDGEPGYRKFDRAEEIVDLEPGALARAVAAFPCRDVVLTGGEPLLQQEGWLALVRALRARDPGYRFEVETNATLLPEPELEGALERIVASPKLANAGMPARLRERPEVLEALARNPKTCFKLVLSRESELAEVLALTGRYRIEPERVYLMPEGTRPEELRARGRWLAELCKAHGFRYSDRLHVQLYGDVRGV